MRVFDRPVTNGDSMENDVLSATKSKKCVLCDRSATDKYKPFCSKRCADIDLHRWFSGAYAVPAPMDPEDEALNNTEEA